MFGLKQRLLIWFGGLLAILATLGALGIVRMTHLGQSIDVILRENFRSVEACQEMKEAAERMDSGTLFVFSGYDEEGRSLIETNRPRFEAALQVELHNITLPGEGELATHLDEVYRRYDREMDAYLAPSLQDEARKSAYFDRLYPVFLEVKNTAHQILVLNERNMTQASASAKAEAASARRQMLSLLAAAMALGATSLFFAGRWILRPVARLTESAEEIRKGNLDLVLPVERKDEIGGLSAAFNAMAEGLRDLRRSDQARLARIQRATEEAIRNLPEAVALVNREGTVELASGRAADDFGLRPGTQARHMLVPFLVDLLEGVLREDPKPGEGGREVIQHFVRGEERFYRPRALPMVQRGDSSWAILLVLEDVTALKQQEELKRGVIATVSHQLRTPLTSLRMAVHLLLDEKTGPLNSKQTELLVAAREESDRLHRMLTDLLDISRLQSGRARLDCQRTEVHSLLLEMTEPFRPSARDHGVELALELPGDVPDVSADRPQVGHVFANLLSNALKYTRPGGRVTLSAREEGEVVRFAVSDTGKGIPAEDLPHLFEPFFRVRGQEEAGAGLGLAIVKQIVEAHGGKVEATSTVGQGSTFTFTLPRADQDDRAVREEAVQ